PAPSESAAGVSRTRRPTDSGTACRKATASANQLAHQAIALRACLRRPLNPSRVLKQGQHYISRSVAAANTIYGAYWLTSSYAANGDESLITGFRGQSLRPSVHNEMGVPAPQASRGRSLSTHLRKGGRK